MRSVIRHAIHATHVRTVTYAKIPATLVSLVCHVKSVIHVNLTIPVQLVTCVRVATAVKSVILPAIRVTVVKYV